MRTMLAGTASAGGTPRAWRTTEMAALAAPRFAGVISCSRAEAAVVEELRTSRPCALTRVEQTRRAARRVA
jgi:hypothetical protein